MMFGKHFFSALGLYSPVPQWRGGEGGGSLQFIQVVIQSRDSFLKTLALTCISHDLKRLA